MEITVNGLTIKIIPDLRGVVEKPVRRTEPMETENMTGKNLSYELVNGNRFHVNALFIMKACHRFCYNTAIIRLIAIDAIGIPFIDELYNFCIRKSAVELCKELSKLPDEDESSES